MDTSNTTEEIVSTAQESIDFAQKLFDNLAAKANVLVSALLILIIGWYVCNFLSKIIKKAVDRSKLDESVSGFINSIVKIGLRVLLLLIVVQKLGVDTTSIVALITSASLAVGLALQGSLTNFAGGFLLLILKPFQIGDYISDGSGHEGTVETIEMIYTKIITPTQEIVWIPNGTLANATITNYSRQPQRRIDFAVGISYGENIDRVRKVLLDVAEESAFPDKTGNPPSVFVNSFDSSSVSICLRVFCPTSQYWDTKFDIQERIKKHFDAEGISIPFDQLDVNIVSGPKTEQ